MLLKLCWKTIYLFSFFIYFLFFYKEKQFTPHPFYLTDYHSTNSINKIRLVSEREI